MGRARTINQLLASAVAGWLAATPRLSQGWCATLDRARPAKNADSEREREAGRACACAASSDRDSSKCPNIVALGGASPGI